MCARCSLREAQKEFRFVVRCETAASVLYSEVEIEDFTLSPFFVVEEVIVSRVWWDILDILSLLRARRSAHSDLNFSNILVLGKLESIRDEIYEHLEYAARIQYCPIYVHVLDAVLGMHL